MSIPGMPSNSPLIRALDAVGRLRRRSASVDRLCRAIAQVAAARMRKMRSGLGKGLLIDVGDGPLSLLIGNREPDVDLALEALLGPGITFYDIGANIGYYTLIGARLVGPAGRVVAFEPVPRHLERLRQNVALNHLANVCARPEALGDKDGGASFALTADPTQNKLAVQTTASDRIVGHMDVSVRRLDTLVGAQEIPLPDFIKMDIEGGEVKALAGARETIRRSRPVLLIELHGTERGVASSLMGLDYHIYWLLPKPEMDQPHIVALPSERQDLREKVAGFSAPVDAGPR